MSILLRGIDPARHGFEADCKHETTYYSAVHDNFYCQTCKAGMGEEYYRMMKPGRPATAPEPPPTSERADKPAVWDLVVADMRGRDQVGRAKYGTPLQADNGRDALVDAYQEALDLAVYLRQEIEERRLAMVKRNKQGVHVVGDSAGVSGVTVMVGEDAIVVSLDELRDAARLVVTARRKLEVARAVTREPVKPGPMVTSALVGKSAPADNGLRPLVTIKINGEEYRVEPPCTMGDLAFLSGNVGPDYKLTFHRSQRADRARRWLEWSVPSTLVQVEDGDEYIFVHTGPTPTA